MRKRAPTFRVPLLPRDEIDRIVRLALREDLGPGDLTTESAIDPGLRAEAVVVAREGGTMAGGPVAARVFRLLDPAARVEILVPEGRAFRRGERLLRVRGDARGILQGERTALNFLQHLCGVATETACVVRSLRKTAVAVLATRKTVPGVRVLQKYAVCAGGGSPHRQGLFDEVLLKENHFSISAMHPFLLVRKIRAAVGPRVRVGAEARSLREAEHLLRGGADWILLDNMTPRRLRRIVPRLRALASKLGRRIPLEASGGIDRKNARAFAQSGVDRISIGALTHSVSALDLGLDLKALSRTRRRSR